jgi:hypothetical protein
MKQILIWLAFILFCNTSIAQLNPKKSSLRDLSPDRPHQTESPITVDKWHIMIESDVVNFKNEMELKNRIKTLGLGAANLKIGFHKRMDFEIISTIFSKQTYENNIQPTNQGFCKNFTFRYKYNLIGNDSGSLAIAIMPLINTNNFFNEKGKIYTAGILVNAEKEVGNLFGLGYTGGFSSFTVDRLFNQYEIFNTVSLDYKVIGKLHFFHEVSHRYNKSAAHLSTFSFDSGCIYTVNNNLQFDSGFYYFIQPKTLFLFMGGTIRI